MNPASNTTHTVKHDLEKASKRPSVGSRGPPAVGTLDEKDAHAQA